MNLINIAKEIECQSYLSDRQSGDDGRPSGRRCQHQIRDRLCAKFTAGLQMK